MRKITTYIAALALAVSSLGLAITASAAANPQPNGSNKLQCFDGTSDGGFYGLCSISNGGGTLNNNSPSDTPAGNDATGTSNPYDQYSGVYITGSNLSGKALSSVNNISFNYTG